MVTETNDDYYCPRCSISDNSKQTVKKLGTWKMTNTDMMLDWVEFNCGVCKLKTILGVTNA